MFGHQHEEKHDEESVEKSTTIAPDQPADTSTPASDDPATDTPAPVPADHTLTATTDTDEADDNPVTTDDNAWQHPGAPLEDEDEDANEEDAKEETKSPEPIKDIVGSSAGPDFKPFPHDDAPDTLSAADTDHTPHELIDIKQNALNDLMPLADQLDQTPEDKFRTTMMMIQASDDQSLIKTAYEAAHQIKDDKVRAQALLDVVNEINYFTQHPEA